MFRNKTEKAENDFILKKFRIEYNNFPFPELKRLDAGVINNPKIERTLFGRRN